MAWAKDKAIGLPNQIHHSFLAVATFIVNSKMHCPYSSINDPWSRLKRLGRGTGEAIERSKKGKERKKCEGDTDVRFILYSKRRLQRVTRS